MAWRELLSAGIDVTKDTILLEGKEHDAVVMAILNGAVDAGTVRTDTMERMEDEGKIKISDFKIINEKNDNFPFRRSTILYPEWPMAALKGVDGTKMATALMALKKTDIAATTAKIIGWSAPMDYNPVVQCLKEIKYGAFAN